MRHSYEIPVVFRIAPSEEEFRQAIDQVVAWIESSNEMEAPGQVTKIDRTRLGRRRLAYEIGGQREGFYILFYADIEPTHLPDFEYNMKLYDPVLRYLVIRDEKKESSTPSENIQTDYEDSDETDD